MGSSSRLDVDEVVIATGSIPRMLDVPGGDKVMTAAQVLLEEKAPGKRIVLVGGGQVGCETAIWLKERGHEVVIVEGREDLILGGSEPIPQPNRDMLLELLIFHDISVYLNSKVLNIGDGFVLVKVDDKEEKISTDSVVISIGYEANDELYRKVYGKTNKNVWLVGYAKQPLNIMMAIRDGSAIGAIM